MCETVQLLEMLSTLQPREAAGAEADLGAGIASGELPHAQACVLYVLQTGVVEQLSEAGQRLLLERCAPHAPAYAPAGLCPCKPKHKSTAMSTCRPGGLAAAERNPAARLAALEA